jgi:uncharacterized protein YegJ (DUF2314 family)
MKRSMASAALRFITLVVAAAVIAGAVPASAALAQGIVKVPNSDQPMETAISKAQASLPVFFERLTKPQPGDERFSVKIRYATTGDSGEHIWANDVVREGDKVSATIGNKPADIPNLKMGQRVTVPVTQLTDWMYMNGGKIHGGQTIRALLPTLPKADADRLKAMLAPE